MGETFLFRYTNTMQALFYQEGGRQSTSIPDFTPNLKDLSLALHVPGTTRASLVVKNCQKKANPPVPL